MTPATPATQPEAVDPINGCIAVFAQFLAVIMLRALFILFAWKVGVEDTFTDESIGWWDALGLSAGVTAVGSAFTRSS